MVNHVKILDKIPSDIFNAAQEEVLKIDWNNLLIPDRRSESSVFKTSITNHLRVHKIKKDTPHTIEALSAIVECVDTPARLLYPNVDRLIDWIFNNIEGTKLGRIMVVKLLPGGVIQEHLDPGPYFQAHYRFHVPFITHADMVFYGPGKLKPIHMPEGYLSQLANRDLHSAENNSHIERIHLIVDIDSNNPIYNI
jgi:hypothetical protein